MKLFSFFSLFLESVMKSHKTTEAEINRLMEAYLNHAPEKIQTRQLILVYYCELLLHVR